MSDYGFATYDGTLKGRLDGVVNSKYPIFGPKYDKIGQMFRTLHIIDNVEQSLGKVTPAPNYGGSGYSGRTSKLGSEKKLIAKFRHGLGYRPVGYAYINGKIVKTIRCSAQQWTDIESEREYLVGGDFGPLYANTTTTTEVYPSVETQMHDGNIGFGGNLLFSAFSVGYSAAGSGWPTPTITIPTACAWINYASGAGFYEGNFNQSLNIRYSYDWHDYPYVVEIDDEYVKVYRKVCWAYYRYRTQENNSGSGRGVYDVKMDLKGIEDYSGSEFDMTVYLCPYKMEDLL